MSLRFAYEPRTCEQCGSERHEELWRYTHEAKTRHQVYLFEVRNVICSGCGFVFVTPVPTADSLAPYYADAFSALPGQRPDYDLTARLDVLDSVTRGRARLVEIGANQPTEFHERARRMFADVTTVEINDSVNSDARSLGGLADGICDVVAHYFVLEHVTQVRGFIMECARLLRPDGVMIVEVPDLAIYPSDPVALGNFEHMSHFSRGMLDRIAVQCGLSPVAVGAGRCSRPFGMVAAYGKNSGAQPVVTDSEYAVNLRHFQAGQQRLTAMRSSLLEAWQRVESYRAQGRHVIFWGANEILDRFLDGRVPGDRVQVVDSDPLKASFGAAYPVATPEAARSAIAQSAAIFLFTRIHAPAILRDLAERFGKTYGHDHVHVVDYGVMPNETPQ